MECFTARTAAVNETKWNVSNFQSSKSLLKNSRSICEPMQSGKRSEILESFTDQIACLKNWLIANRQSRKTN